MSRLRSLLVSIPLLGALGCFAPIMDPQPPQPPEPPYPKATCDDVCTHWRNLGCPEGQPTPAGASCTEVCDHVQSSGVIRWHLGCRAKIDSCDQIDTCD